MCSYIFVACIFWGGFLRGSGYMHAMWHTILTGQIVFTERDGGRPQLARGDGGDVYFTHSEFY